MSGVQYPSSADAVWALPLGVASLGAALAAGHVMGSIASLVFGVLAVLLIVASIWWSTRRQRLIRMMGKTPAWEGTALIDTQLEKRGRRWVNVTLRDHRSWRWRVEGELPDAVLGQPCRVRVWVRGLDVVARADEFTLWPVGLARPQRDSGPERASA